jgi:hypothetical protein
LGFPLKVGTSVDWKHRGGRRRRSVDAVSADARRAPSAATGSQKSSDRGIARARQDVADQVLNRPSGLQVNSAGGVAAQPTSRPSFLRRPLRPKTGCGAFWMNPINQLYEFRLWHAHRKPALKLPPPSERPLPPSADLPLADRQSRGSSTPGRAISPSALSTTHRFGTPPS